MVITLRFWLFKAEPVADRQPGVEHLPKRQTDALLSLAALDMAHRSRP
jgi:hypothetical protein